MLVILTGLQKGHCPPSIRRGQANLHRRLSKISEADPKTSENVLKPHEGCWKWSTTEIKKFYVMFWNVIENYLTDFGFHGVGLNYSGLLYQILRQRCSIFFKMANLWEMNYLEFKLILPIITDFVAWTAFDKKAIRSKIGFLGFVTFKFQSALFVFQKSKIFVLSWHQSPAFPRLASANCFGWRIPT